jgi:hypothetical protein
LLKLRSVTIAGAASLISATLDLKMVQSVIAAMRAADRASDRCEPCGTFDSIAPRNDCRRFHLHPTPFIEPRPVLHPTPRILPRPVLHPQPRVELQPPPVAPDPHCHSSCKSPFPPPWKVLPWKIPIPPPVQIKQVIHRTDVKNKGSLIDMFI